MLNNKNASMNRHVYVYFNVEKQNNHYIRHSENYLCK